MPLMAVLCLGEARGLFALCGDRAGWEGGIAAAAVPEATHKNLLRREGAGGGTDLLGSEFFQ